MWTFYSNWEGAPWRAPDQRIIPTVPASVIEPSAQQLAPPLPSGLDPEVGFQLPLCSQTAPSRMAVRLPRCHHSTSSSAVGLSQPAPRTRGRLPPPQRSMEASMDSYTPLRSNLWFQHDSLLSCIHMHDHDVVADLRAPRASSREDIFRADVVAMTAPRLLLHGGHNGTCWRNAPNSTRLIVVSWNPGATQGDKCAMAEHIAGRFHLVALQGRSYRNEPIASHRKEGTKGSSIPGTVTRSRRPPRSSSRGRIDDTFRRISRYQFHLDLRR